MLSSLHQWHLRYQQQARWTKTIRDYVFSQANLATAERILEVGCGTGVIIDDIRKRSNRPIIGIDINPASISFAKSSVPNAIFTTADGLNLPFAANSFDICVCHFLLLWVINPQQVLNEMVRVTKINGFVISLAEPDYGGRIDFPHELSVLGDWQIESLHKQGANPLIGRELLFLFRQSGLMRIEVGVLGGQWKDDYIHEDSKLEWDVIESDLKENREFREKSYELKSIEQFSRAAHQRILYVPTFYGIGQVKA